MRKWLMLVALGAFALTFALPASADDDSKRFRGSDCGPFQVVDDPTLALPLVRTTDTAFGRANHGIGRYTLEASEVINLSTLAVTDGEFTMTTRKGSFSGTYEGQAAGTDNPAVITYHVEGPITAGTGRFQGVTGRIVFDGVATFTSATTGELCDEVRGVLFEPDDDDDDDEDD